MTRTFFKILILTFAAAAAVFASPIPAAYAEDGGLRQAPLDPAFLQYLEALKLRGAPAPLKTRTGHRLGKIPSPTTAIAGPPPSAGAKSGAQVSYPSAYDLRDHNKLTPVKNQGNCGSCWAYAAMSSMESYFKPGETLDLSEADLDVNSGFDSGSCNGGDDKMSAAYMTRWDGPVVEGSTTVVKHAQNILLLTRRTGPADNDRIKAALLAYGGLGVAFYYDDGYYNPGTSSFYANISANDYVSNHEVTLVGWDDNYSKTNFLAAPPGDGAFICKNSWDTDWGDSGYFYVSYYDGLFGRDAYVSAFTGEGIGNYTTLYSYDKLGWVADLGYSTTTAWYSNIFTAAGNEKIKAAGFYTNDAYTDYTVYLYLGVTAGLPTSGTLAYSASGSFSSPGYYTVPVGYQPVTGGQLFSVVVKATNAGYKYPVPVEAKLAGYSSLASSSGRSYVSRDGAAWDALTVLYSSYTNVNLKAYSTRDLPSGTAALTDNLLRPLKNPAAKCRIAVTVYAAGNVAVKAYTTNGGLVKTIYNGPQNSGAFTYFWDGKTENGNLVASGLYLINITGPNTNITEKVVVIK